MEAAAPGDEAPIATIPIYLSNSLSPHLAIHQFPLLTNLKAPDAAAAAGRRIKARHKPKSGIVEVRVPLDTRPDVYNAERGRELGTGREGEDVLDGSRSKKKRGKQKAEEDEDGDSKRLDEVRMASERAPRDAAKKTTNMIGILRGNKMYLHPVERTYQLRPSLDYLDILSAKTKLESRKTREYESEGEEEVGDDPETGEPKEKKPKVREAKEVVSVAKGPMGSEKDTMGGVTDIRKKMLLLMRDEKEEKWHDLEWQDSDSAKAEELYESLFTAKDTKLKTTTKLSDVLRTITPL